MSQQKKKQKLKRMVFGEALAHLMKQQKVSEMELAVQLEVMPLTIMYWVMDAIPPPDRSLAVKIAKILGVSPKLLLVALLESEEPG